MDVPKNKNKFVAGLASKFDTEEKDATSLKSKKITMEKVLKDITKFPNKLHVVGPVGVEKAKPTAPRENPLHGGEGEDPQKEYSEK